MLVRVHHSRVDGRGPRRWACVGFLVLSLTACGLFSSRDGSQTGYYLPLTVQVRQTPTITAAQVAYQDACGKNQVVTFGPQLAEAVNRKSGRVFEKVVTGSGPPPAPVDGYEDVSVGLTSLDLFIPRKVARSYPAILTI